MKLCRTIAPETPITGASLEPSSARAAERATERLGKESHQRRGARAGRHEAGGKVRRAGLSPAEVGGGRERQTLEILDQRMVSIEAAGRSLQAGLVVREAGAAG